MGVAVGFASPTVSVQKLFQLPVSTSGFVADIRVFDVGNVIFGSTVVENVGVAAGIVSLSLSVQELLLRLLSTCQFSGSKPPFWYFRLIDTRDNDVIL